MADIPVTAVRLAGALALGMASIPAAQAQNVSHPVIQPLPPPEAAQLSAALQRLAANPRDLEALIAAGDASLKLDDIDAALGFFARADEIAPGEPRAKAGVAAAMVKDENPFDALRLFDEAERAGATLTEVAGDRALAYDLVGDNAHAQQLYRAVLARGEDAETSRRLAVSLAIAGDQVGMERVLLPMLQRQDLAAYRARAFALAILGKVDEAMTISDARMPPAMAARMAPYLRLMPRLTRAQQAAAANLGNFPRPADVGRDDPRVARHGGQPGAPVSEARGADARLVPAGEPLGPAPDTSRRRPDRPDEPGEQVALAQPAPVIVEPEPQPEPEAPVPQAPINAPAFDLGQVAGSTETAAAQAPEPVAPPPAPEPEPAPAPSAPQADVAGAFADFQVVLSPAQVAAGAVDLSRIEAPRERKEEPKPPPKPVPPKAPSRVWVQLATGRDRAALGFDWRRMLRDSKGVLADHKAFLARWGSTNRLLTGPFASDRAAQAFVSRLKTAGVDSFAFTSAEGEDVSPLAGR